MASMLKNFSDCSLSKAAKVVTVGTITAGVAYYILRASRTKTTPCGQLLTPPGPEPTHADLGNIEEIGQAGSLHEYLLKLHADYSSDVVKFWYGKTLCYSVSSAKAFKCLKNLFDRPVLLFQLFEPLLSPRSIQYANGEDGKDRRRIYDKMFSHESCLNMIPLFNEVGNHFIDRVLSKESFDLEKELVASAIEAISQVTIGEYFKDPAHVDELASAYHVVWHEMENRLMFGMPEPGSDREVEFNKYLPKLRELCSDFLRDRRLNPNEASDAIFIDTLMDYWGDDDDAIIADTISYLIGGFHTTASSLTWAIYYAAKYPEVQNKMRNEAQSVIGDNLDFIENEHVNNLKYIRQVLNEALRAACVAPMAARVNDEADCKINGFNVPKNTPVVISLGVSLMDPNVWPEPEKFDPDRFDESNAEIINSLAFQPFGFAGKRKCPGYRFAYLEQVLWLGKWFGQLQFSLLDSTFEAGKVFRLVTSPSEPIMMRVQKHI